MKIKDHVLVQGDDKTPWRIFIPTKSDKEWVVLWLQGFTSTIESHNEGCIRMAENTQTAFAMLNYAGHGNHPTSLDEATRAQQFKEVCGIYDELAELGYKKIIVIGGSFGGYMAALLTAKRPIEACVLRAPAIYADEEFNLPYKKTRSAKTEERKDLWRESVTPETPNRALRAIKNFDGDVFVMEHELDSIVNRAVPQAYFAVAKHSNYIVIRNCEHSPKLMPSKEKFFKIIEDWNTTIIKNIKASARK